MADIIRAGVLWGYGPLVLSMGRDPAALLAEAGLSRDALDDPDNYIPRRAAAALLEATARRLDCPDFGMRLAGMQDVNVLGALAFAIRKAADVRGAIRVAASYAHFHCPAMRLSSEPIDGAAEEWLVVSWSGEWPAGVQFVEHAIARIARVSRHLTNGAVRITRARFTHPQSAPRAAYEEALGVFPEFGGEFNAVAFSRRDLTFRFRSPDRPFQAIVERYLDMHAPAPAHQTIRQVHGAIARVMRQGGQATMTDAAELLRIHPRTLQRRLTAEGATFEQLRDEVRRDLAEVYLAHDVIPVAQVAEMLGYANQSALTRSCVRWFGKTPLRIRKELAARRS